MRNATIPPISSGNQPVTQSAEPQSAHMCAVAGAGCQDTGNRRSAGCQPASTIRYVTIASKMVIRLAACVTALGNKMEHFFRRSLPHWYMPGAAHFVTYRLAGTLPAHVIQELKAKKVRLMKEKSSIAIVDNRRHVHKLLFAAYEEYLDSIFDINWLREPRIASMLRENLYHHDGNKYHLHAYCIMPNHVHIVLTPSPDFVALKQESTDIGELSDKGSPISKIMHSLKSYTANEANKILKRSGRFWQPESYDHWIRDDEELERIVNYVRGNPVAAKLVAKPEDWYWSSCHDRFLMDGDTSGWLPTT